jgi:hypothetical protein
MNKKNRQAMLALMLTLGMSSAFAALNLPLGSGTLDGTVNKTAKVSLAMLVDQPVTYDVNCTFTSPNADQFPVILGVQLDKSLQFGSMTATFVDGEKSLTGQFKLSNKAAHVASVTVAGSSLQPQTNFVLSWLASDDMTTSLNYNCVATPSTMRK